MKQKTQDAKFWIDTETHRLVGQSGPVPEDEPLFILRARDVNAIDTLRAYQSLARERGAAAEHVVAVDRALWRFRVFASEHRDRMKVPDTEVASLHDGVPEATE